MENLDAYIAFVKEQISFQLRMASKYSTNAYRSNLHHNAVMQFQGILALLESLRDGPADVGESPAKAVNARRRIMLSLDDLKNIPSDLLNELNLSDTDKQDMLIESIIADSGGILSLDKILVELYRRTGAIHKRNTVISRLYRMGNRGLIYSLPSKKGIYSTYELSEQDVKRLFGQLDSEPEPTAGIGGSLTVSPSGVISNLG
jgi:hypothetical protein